MTNKLMLYYNIVDVADANSLFRELNTMPITVMISVLMIYVTMVTKAQVRYLRTFCFFHILLL